MCPPGFDPAMVAGEQKQQTRGAAIAVAERMDAQKVKVELPAAVNRRVNPFFPNPALPEFDHLRHRLGCLFCRDGFESHAAAAIRVVLDDVHVLLLVKAGVPDLTTAQFMDRFDGALGNGKIRAALVNEIQRVAIAANLFLVAVAKRPACRRSACGCATGPPQPLQCDWKKWRFQPGACSRSNFNRCGDWRVNNSCLLRAPRRRSARYQAGARGRRGRLSGELAQNYFMTLGSNCFQTHLPRWQTRQPAASSSEIAEPRHSLPDQTP